MQTRPLEAPAGIQRQAGKKHQRHELTSHLTAPASKIAN
jgi:hypothetical protein